MGAEMRDRNRVVSWRAATLPLRKYTADAILAQIGGMELRIRSVSAILALLNVIARFAA